ncbi:MAG: cobalamin-dependent protein [Steroidobacteraceae bacterium]|nr:cobalamin-dependent protein [Steroidobacteraceae bacterium]
MDSTLGTLGPAGMERFQRLRAAAVTSVADRLERLRGHDGRMLAAVPGHLRRHDLAALLQFLEPSVEYGLLQPMADYLDWIARRNGMRTIAAEQVTLVLDCFAEYFLAAMDVEEGTTVADALRAAKVVFAATGGRREPLPAPPEPWPQTAEFADALVEGRQGRAARIMRACLDDGHDMLAFQLHVVQPALYEIGRRWQQDSLSVACEHLATNVARTVMAAGLAGNERRCSNRRRVLLACAEGNRHDLGLQMVGDAFRHAGWNVRCLGADVPTDDLVQHAAHWNADLLGLSVAFAHQLRSIRAVASGLRAAGEREALPILAGGIAARRFERLARHLGADAVAADAAAAVVAASRLIGRAHE